MNNDHYHGGHSLMDQNVGTGLTFTYLFDRTVVYSLMHPPTR